MNKKISYIFLLVLTLVIAMSIWAVTEAKYYAPLGVSLFFWCATVYSVRKSSVWTGTLLFVLAWLCFPLLQIINVHWIDWHADDLLIRIDSFIWGGQILPAYFRYENHVWLTDIFCLCYFCFYFIVVGGVVNYAIKRHHATATAFFNGLLFIYLIGYIGYFSLPAAGPAFYNMPDTGIGGHNFTQLLIDTIKEGVTGMDAFPSLHTAVTTYIVGYFYRDGLTKTARLLTPISIGIICATIFMRYHYGIDVIIGVLLAGFTLWQFSPPKSYQKA